MKWTGKPSRSCFFDIISEQTYLMAEVLLSSPRCYFMSSEPQYFYISQRAKVVFILSLTNISRQPRGPHSVWNTVPHLHKLTSEFRRKQSTQITRSRLLGKPQSNCFSDLHNSFQLFELPVPLINGKVSRWFLRFFPRIRIGEQYRKI